MSVQAATCETPADFVAALWRRILRRDDFEPDASFFALGGGSIDVVQMLAEVGNHYDVDLDYRSFFEVPTLETLLRLLNQEVRP